MVMCASASEMCVSWGASSVGGCSACLPVPHSSTATSHSYRNREEESTNTSPAHSDPVVHSPRRSKLQNMKYSIYNVNFNYCFLITLNEFWQNIGTIMLVMQCC